MRRKFVSGRKERRKRRREKQQEQPSMIGKIIDLPLEEFKAELAIQKVNVGPMNNLLLNLESIYFDLRQ